MRKQMLNLTKAILKIAFFLSSQESSVKPGKSITMHEPVWRVTGPKLLQQADMEKDGKVLVEGKELSSYPEFTDLRRIQEIPFPLAKQILLALGKYCQG